MTAGGIHGNAVEAIFCMQRLNVWQRTALRVEGILQQAAGGGDAEGQVVAAKAVEISGSKLTVE